MEYFVYSKVECEKCRGCGSLTFYNKDGFDVKVARCIPCDGTGQALVEVNLLDLLGELRFSIGDDDGRSCFIDPRWDEAVEQHLDVK